MAYYLLIYFILRFENKIHIQFHVKPLVYFILVTLVPAPFQWVTL